MEKGYLWVAMLGLSSLVCARSAPFILGADVSWLPEREAAGWTYYDGPVRKDAIQILKEHKFNWVRLRIFVDPKAAGGYSSQGFCDLEHTKAMAKRIKAAGMNFLLDFHYSDTWADPGNQIEPAAWKGLPIDSMAQAMRAYTRQALAELKAQGTLPDMVQDGNEINGGLLRPSGSTDDWIKLGKLLKAGVAGVRDVDPDIRIMLHLASGGDNEYCRYFYDNAIKQGVEFQVIGLSCYTEYQGPPDGWERNFQDLVARYPDHAFAIAEYSQEKRAANDIMFGLPGGKGLGTFIWEPMEWMEAVFDSQAGKKRVANALLDLYPAMSRDYGNDDVSAILGHAGRTGRIRTAAPGSDGLAGSMRFFGPAMGEAGWIGHGADGRARGAFPRSRHSIH